MDEDIKILEDLIETYKNCGVDDYPEMVVDFSLSKKEIQAMKNLINEYEDVKAMIMNPCERAETCYTNAFMHFLNQETGKEEK